MTEDKSFSLSFYLLCNKCINLINNHKYMLLLRIYLRNNYSICIFFKLRNYLIILANLGIRAQDLSKYS